MINFFTSFSSAYVLFQKLFQLPVLLVYYSKSCKLAWLLLVYRLLISFYYSFEHFIFRFESMILRLQFYIYFS